MLAADEWLSCPSLWQCLDGFLVLGGWGCAGVERDASPFGQFGVTRVVVDG